MPSGPDGTSGGNADVRFGYLSPWAGFAVLLDYGLVSLAVGGLLLVRRDA